MPNRFKRDFPKLLFINKWLHPLHLQEEHQPNHCMKTTHCLPEAIGTIYFLKDTFIRCFFPMTWPFNLQNWQAFSFRVTSMMILFQACGGSGKYLGLKKSMHPPCSFVFAAQCIGSIWIAKDAQIWDGMLHNFFPLPHFLDPYHSIKARC